MKAENAVIENFEASNDIGRWRDDLREMVMRVRNNFVSFIDEFSLQLKRNLLDMEANPTMSEFLNEDHC